VTKKSRRELEKALAHIRELLSDDDDNDNITVHTDFTEVTDDMVSDDGTVDPAKVPDATAPDGYKLGDVVNQSPALTCHELIPVGEDE
jgi:hypothetical protein